jgi:WD40 repeat protein
MPLRLNISILLCLVLVFSGRAQQVVNLDPLHSVEAFSASIRAGTGRPAEQLIAVLCQDGMIKIYDAATLSERATIEGGTVPLTGILLGAQGTELYSGKSTGKVDVWDVVKKLKIREINVSPWSVLRLAEAPQQRILVAGFDKIIRLVEVATGKTLCSSSSLPDEVKAIGIDPSGTFVLAVTEGGWIRSLRLSDLSEVKKADSRASIARATLSPDGKWIAYVGLEGTVRVWDVGTPGVAASFEVSRKPITALAIDPTNRWLLAGSADSTVHLYDLSKNALARSIPLSDGYATVAAFINPELLWVGTSKGTVKTWRIREAPLDSLPPAITFLQPEEPRRIYGTSVLIKGEVRDGSTIKEIVLEQGGGTLQIADVQEKDRVAGGTVKTFVIEGKLEKPGDNSFSIRAVDESGNVARQSLSIEQLAHDQIIEITNPPNNFDADQVSTKLQFKVWCEASSYRVSVNLQEVAEKADLLQRKPGELMTEEIPLYVGYNQIQISVVNKNGEKLEKTWGVNRKVYGAISVNAPSKFPTTTRERGLEPQVWAVVVGISEYANKAIPPLRYADQDALAFAEFLQKPEGGGIQPDHMQVLTNKDATLANVRNALVEFLSHAIDKDLVLIFFAGHGAPDPARPTNLFMLTNDTDPSRLGTTAYPMWEMQTLLTRQISAKRIVVFSDACHSGGISVDFATRGVNATDSNLINQYLADLARTKEGIVVFTASAAGEVSQELPELGHGVFTYFLLEGMKGEADLNNDYTVTINELMQYVEDQVKRKTKGAQTPTRSQTIYDKDLTISKIAH